MKKEYNFSPSHIFLLHLTILVGVGAIIMFLFGCNNKSNKQSNSIIFAISADYPPFEYYENGEIKGFDIDLAVLVAEKMGKKAVFENIQFNSIFPALQNNFADAAISTIAITKERQENFDFSIPYYNETLAAVFKKENPPITNISQLLGKKVSCQLGTTMEIWLKKHITLSKIITMDNSNQVIEAVKAGYVDVAFIDGMQAAIFSQKNTGLSYAIIDKSEEGYGIALKKGSNLKESINHILKILKINGEIKKLEQKWLGIDSWKK